MHDDANFLADTADIRSLLAGTDSAPEVLEPGAVARMSGIRNGILKSGGRARRLRTSRRPVLAAAWTGLAAAVAVAASLGGLMLRAGPPGQYGQSGPPLASPGGQVTAVQLLSKIADAAASQPQQRVTDNQFEYIASQVSFSTGDDQKPFPPTPDQTHLRQIWIPVADLCGPGLLIEYGKKISISESSVAQLVPGHHSGQKKVTAKVKTPAGWHVVKPDCPDRGSLNDPTYRLLQSLPTNPRALLKLIYREDSGGQPADEEAFTTIGDLLRESIAPPEVSAALYRAAALIPGVTVISDAADAIGRPGVGVSYTANGYQQEWIFDKTTLSLLGERDFSNGTLTGKTAIITRAFTDQPGESPREG